MRREGRAMAAPTESLRKRRRGDADAEPGSPPAPAGEPVGCPGRLREGTFWLTRVVLLRALAFVYFVAFLVAFQQNKQLIGDQGLLPSRLYLKSIQQHFKGRIGWDTLSAAPTLLWFLDWSNMDASLDCLALAGLGISSFVLVAGCANMVLMTALWVLYMSLVNVGQIWYAFGWESQLLETGFLGIFLCPLWTLSRLPRHTPTSHIVIWGFRWLIFRIMLGAVDTTETELALTLKHDRACRLAIEEGLIKIRGDRCWRELTCMDYHYETQPVPNPAAYYLHRSPWWIHRTETLGNHIVELLVPFFLPLGRRLSLLHGTLQILFQVLIILSGNLSFLNWLTIVPSLACFDDAALSFLFPSGPGGLRHGVVQLQKEEARGAWPPQTRGRVLRRAVHLSLAALIGCLSVPVILNLLSSQQVMNVSFNPLRIVNTYGAFGSITKERTEVILQGTASPNASAPDAVWLDYEFKCKPGDPRRRPCLISPYHHRLDWLMWFAAFQTYEQHEWIIHLAGKLLTNDAGALSLLAHNPFHGRMPPRWVRAEHYRYKFSRPGGQHAADGAWWVRKRIGPYFPPLSLRDLRDYFKAREWPHPEST